MFLNFHVHTFLFWDFLWEREKTNSITITRWCIGRFYHLFAPRNNTLHCFCLVNPKVLTKMAGIKNIIRSIPGMPYPPTIWQSIWQALSFFLWKATNSQQPKIMYQSILKLPIPPPPPPRHLTCMKIFVQIPQCVGSLCISWRSNAPG